MTFTDPDNVVRVRYPSEWTATKTSTDKANALSLFGSNNEVVIFIEIYPPGSETIDQNFKRICDGGATDEKTALVYDPVRDTQVAGQTAKSMAYRYYAAGKPSVQIGTVTIWIVDHNGKRYEFSCSNIDLHRPEIEAFMNSVAFLK
jgi:hypothetical protein